jgi:hypothetical protein
MQNRNNNDGRVVVPILGILKTVQENWNIQFGACVVNDMISKFKSLLNRVEFKIKLSIHCFITQELRQDISRKLINYAIRNFTGFIVLKAIQCCALFLNVCTLMQG